MNKELERLVAALEDIASSVNLTGTPKQFADHLQREARKALAAFKEAQSAQAEPVAETLRDAVWVKNQADEYGVWSIQVKSKVRIVEGTRLYAAHPQPSHPEPTEQEIREAFDNDRPRLTQDTYGYEHIKARRNTELGGALWAMRWLASRGKGKCRAEHNTTVGSESITQPQYNAEESKFSVLFVTNAYESGVGHAFDDLCNPYKEGSSEHEAYDLGKKFGKERGIGKPETHRAHAGWPTEERESE